MSLEVLGLIIGLWVVSSAVLSHLLSVRYGVGLKFNHELVGYSNKSFTARE